MIRRHLSPRIGCVSIIALAVIVLGVVAVAWAYFSSTGSSTASAAVGSVNLPGNITAQQVGSGIQVSWDAATLSTGAPVDGYRVTRSDGSSICGATTLVTAVSCTDTNPTAGTPYTYMVTAVYRSFSAAASSAAVTFLLAPSIDTHPSNPSADAAPSFSFSGGAGSGYECRLDGGSFASCSSSKSYSGLTDGSHTFKVHATDGGSAGPDATFTWTIDTAAPSITAKPSAASANTSPSFSFTHTEGSYTFRCELDGAGLTDCTSPKPYSSLATGSHTFHVEGVSADGATTSVASYSWTIDTSAPSITSKPSNPSTSTSASFQFSHTQATYTFQCKLDSGSFALCTSTKTYSSLSDGSHTFQVLGVSADGSQTSGASYTWVVDATAPTDALSLASGASNAAMNAAGTRLYYRGNTSGSFSIVDAVTDSGTGPASATFPAIGTTGWTHGAETVSSGSGSAPTISYASSTFSWTASPSVPSGYKVTSKDAAGNTSPGVTPTFVSDTSAPTSGAFTVNGTAASGGGSTSTTSSTSFTIGSRTDYSESQSTSQSGLKSSVLTVQSETLSAGACGTPGSGGPFTSATTITGTTQPSGIQQGFCYLYILTGTDNVGNTASISSTVKVNTAPTVSSASPSALGQGAAGIDVQINGSNFVSGATVSLGTGVTVNTVTFNSASQLTANVTVSSSATTGSKTVTVTNPDGGLGSKSSGFTVNAHPTISPAPAAVKGATSLALPVTGTGFSSGSFLAASVTGHSGAVTVNSVSVTDSTHLTLNVTVSSSATVASDYTLNLTNGDGGATTSTFAVDNNPSLGTLSPAALGRGATSETVTVNGTGFVNSSLLAASITGHPGVSVTNPTFVSATQIRLTVSVDPSATIATDYTLNVTNGDGGTATENNAFAVTAAPTVTSASSVYAPATGSLTESIVIKGSGFANGSLLDAAVSGSGITVNSVTWGSATQVTASVSVSSSASAGARDVTVTNGDGGTATCTGCLHVFSFTEAGSGSAGSSTTITSTSFTLNAGTAYLVFASNDSSTGDAASLTPTGFTTAPTFTAIGSQEDFNGRAQHNWAWYVTGGSGTGTVKVTFTRTISQAFLEVIAVGGANTGSPVVTTNVGLNVSGGSATSTTTSNSATVSLPNAPDASNGEIVFWSADARASSTEPDVTGLDPVGSVYVRSNSGSMDVLAGAPPLTTSSNLSLGGLMHWGTIALELNHS